MKFMGNCGNSYGIEKLLECIWNSKETAGIYMEAFNHCEAEKQTEKFKPSEVSCETQNATGDLVAELEGALTT